MLRVAHSAAASASFALGEILSQAPALLAQLAQLQAAEQAEQLGGDSSSSSSSGGSNGGGGGGAAHSVHPGLSAAIAMLRDADFDSIKQDNCGDDQGLGFVARMK